MNELLKNIWPEWTIVEKIGSGAFGTVYSAKKEDGGHIYESAIKIIHIPQDEGEVRELRNSGMDYQSICGFYRDVKKDLLNEISVMETLRTASNVVSIDDYKEEPSEDGIGWTMYIRMEKLTSLSRYQETHNMDLNEIVKLGHDLCSALSCCEKKSIIHRDVKPDNIFVNEFGDFKLGDFGISRQLEKTQSVRSQKGTYQYMAPEVYRGDSYNQTVDIYSLGVVLYRLLNNGRFPFVPDAPMPISPTDIDKAFALRMQGKEFPVPMALRAVLSNETDSRRDSCRHLLQAIRKACAYRTEDRYQNAGDFLTDLNRCTGIHDANSDHEGKNTDIRQVWTDDDRTESFLNGGQKGTNGLNPERGAARSQEYHREAAKEESAGSTSSVRKSSEAETTVKAFSNTGNSQSGGAEHKEPDIAVVRNDGEPEKYGKPDQKKGAEPQSSEESDKRTDKNTEKKGETSEILNDSRRHAKKKRAKIIAIVLAGLAVIIIGIFMYINSDGYIWNIDNGVLVKYRGLSREVEVPASVTSIGEAAFKGRSGVTSITLPKSVTSIGDSAFSGCSSLTSITIPEGVTRIGSEAFHDCSNLTSITIPESVTSIGNDAFFGCWGLTSITLPEGVTSIDDWVFCSCSSLTSIAIPDSVTSIGYEAFSNCCSLTSITIPESVTSIGDDAFFGCSKLTSITIPGSVTSIGNEAFKYCSILTSIAIPESVTTIGDSAFSDCDSNLTITSSAGSYAESYAAENNIPFQAESDSTQAVNDGNWKIENGELKRYHGAESSIIIPDNVTSIGEDALSGCVSLISITIPDSVTSIGDYAFDGCSSLTRITIPDSVTNIGKFAFAGCSSLTRITIPDSVTSIGEDTFAGCSSMTSITIPESVTSIGYAAFFGCSSLTSITIPESVTSIGNSAFSNCNSLTSITIPESVVSIKDKAFSFCNSLASITIPETVTSIGDKAFFGCSKLTIISSAGSYAESYAADCNIPFQASS